MPEEVRGLRAFRNELRLLGAAWPAELRRVNKDVADKGAAAARAAAASGTRQQAAASGAIVGKATQESASIGLGSGTRIPFASVAFWGAKRHTGWYAQPKYEGGPPQHPPWIGNTWEPAVAGEGPYVINTALAEHIHELVDPYDDALYALARRAFPD